MIKVHVVTACAAIALLSGSASSQTAPEAPAPAAGAEGLDPARLDEARKLVDIMMPPESREQMIRTALNSLMTTVSKLVNEDPTVSAAAKDPAVKEISMRFIAKMQQTMIEDMTADLPAMVNAMTRAYARRFSIEEMQQAEVFFASAAGKAFVARGEDIMADPDVVAWQRGLMQRQMARLPEMMASMKRDMLAAAKARSGGKTGG